MKLSSAFSISMEEGLPWCWVIETLASSQKISAAILYELLLKGPPLSGDNSGKVREAVALRCLEELVGPSSDTPISNTLKDGFNVSDDCEAVLQMVLSENSGFDLKKYASNELTWNIRSFVDLKKARMPKCSLEMLKNLIVEGTHPIIESLREIKGLELPSKRVVPTISGVDSASSSSNVYESDIDPTFTSPTVYEHGHSGQATLVEENRGSPKDRVQNVDDGLDAHDLPLKKRKLVVGDGLQSQNQPPIPCDGNGTSTAVEDAQNHKSPIGSQEQNGKLNMENLGASGNISGHHSPGTQDLATKMRALFSSEMDVPDHSLAMNETEVNLCMKCNARGDLLICDSNTCRLALHESCLGCSASFDDQGKFYCPLCAYSCANSEYVKAKEKLSRARRELFLFIGSRTSHEPEPKTARALGDDDDDDDDDDDGEGPTEGISKNAEPAITVNNVVTGVANPDSTRVLGDDDNGQRPTEDKQKEFPSIAYKAETPSLLAASLLGEIPSLLAASLLGEIFAQLPRDATEILNQGEDNHNTEGGNRLNQNENIMNTRKNLSDLERKEETAGHQATEYHEDVVCETISNCDVLSEDEKNKINTTPLREVEANNHLTRKRKILWTAEEEAMIKEGVEKFGNDGKKVIPWKKILQLGVSVFHEGRTAMDLKGKWRNMQKSPKVV